MEEHVEGERRADGAGNLQRTAVKPEYRDAQYNVDAENRRVQQEQEKVFVIEETNAVVDPRAMVTAKRTSGLMLC